MTEKILESVLQSKKLNITKHALERWCERILGLDKSEVALYITTNREQLVEHINETFSYSEFIYKGQLGTDNITRHYYIQNNNVFITNTDDNAIITIYKVDLGFTDNINTMLRKEMMKEVAKLQEEKYNIDMEVLEEIDKTKFELQDIDDNIVILERQLAELKQQKKMKSEHIKSINSKSNYVNQELSKYVLKLVNSKEYKDDLNNM